MRNAVRTWIRSLAGGRRTAVLAFTAFVCAALPALAQQAATAPSNRLALVVGEGAYRSTPTDTAPNDAGLVAQLLAGAGFDVTAARDLDGESLRRAFRDFLDRAGAAGPDGIAFVYLSGRALQQDGDNFFVPVDARLARATDVPIEALRLADFTRALAALPIQAKVVVVDAAYPTGVAISRDAAPGLAFVEADQGELIAFNAAPGTIAPAPTGLYGVYAQALVQMMKQGGVPIGEVFNRVRLSVNQTTAGAVVPWQSDALTRSFTLFDRAPAAPASDSVQIPFATLSKRPLRDFPPDQAYDIAVARDTLPAYTEFVTAFPDNPLVRRIRLIIAVRREAMIWRAAVRGGTAPALWTYLARYPRGPHTGEARRRLSRLAEGAEPPARFVPLAFDVPPPAADDIVYDRPLVFVGPDLPPPPPPPVFLLPPPVVIVLPRPLRPAGPRFLPFPVPVALPYVRAPVEPGAIVPPRGVKGGYPRPRPFARGPNGDGLLVQQRPNEPGSPPVPRVGLPGAGAPPVGVPVTRAPPAAGAPPVARVPPAAGVPTGGDMTAPRPPEGHRPGVGPGRPGGTPRPDGRGPRPAGPFPAGPAPAGAAPTGPAPAGPASSAPPHAVPPTPAPTVPPAVPPHAGAPRAVPAPGADGPTPGVRPGIRPVSPPPAVLAPVRSAPVSGAPSTAPTPRAPVRVAPLPAAPAPAPAPPPAAPRVPPPLSRPTPGPVPEPRVPQAPPPVQAIPALPRAPQAPPVRVGPAPSEPLAMPRAPEPRPQRPVLPEPSGGGGPRGARPSGPGRPACGGPGEPACRP